MKKNSKFEIRNSKFVVLAGIAILLLAAILNQQKNKPNLLPSNLTEDERFILNPPSESSKSALKKHAQMVAKLAKKSDFLEIKDCNPTPLVLRTQLRSELEIKNQSTKNHRIIIDSKHYYDIPGGGSKKIKAEFKYGPGDYGYVCEGTGLVGFLHVVE